MRHLIVIATLLILCTSAQAQMYCGHKRVIRPGFTADQVETFCGSPDSVVDYGFGTVKWTYRAQAITNDTYRAATYYFHLTFENGVLVSIERG